MLVSCQTSDINMGSLLCHLLMYIFWIHCKVKLLDEQLEILQKLWMQQSLAEVTLVFSLCFLSNDQMHQIKPYMMAAVMAECQGWCQNA